jgi:hypothetical protein
VYHGWLYFGSSQIEYRHMSAFSCKLCNVVTGKEPRLWNFPKSSCHGAFLDTTNPLEPSHVKTAPSQGGTREIVLLSSWVWKNVNGWALEIGISCTYSNPAITGGRKHTHTALLSSCASWLLCCLSLQCPLVLSLYRPIVLS